MKDWFMIIICLVFSIIFMVITALFFYFLFWLAVQVGG